MLGLGPGEKMVIDADSFQRLTKPFLAEIDALYTCCRTFPSRGSEERVDVPENRDETQCDKGSRKKKGREAQSPENSLHPIQIG